MADFTHVIPIGGNCRLTHNVRRHFDHAESYPFDWWILPLPALLALLRGGLDPDALYAPAMLKRVAGADGAHAHVEHRQLGIRFVHEFPRMPADVTAPVDWEAWLRRPRERLAYLGARLRRLDAPGNSLLFVRFCLASGQGVAPDTGDDLRALPEALARAFPRARTQFLAVGATDAIDGCATLAVDDSSPDWTGDFDLWSSALASTGHRLRNPAIQPYVVRLNDIDVEGAVPSRAARLAALARPFRRRGRTGSRTAGGPAAV